MVELEKNQIKELANKHSIDYSSNLISFSKDIFQLGVDAWKEGIRQGRLKRKERGLPIGRQPKAKDKRKRDCTNLYKHHLFNNPNFINLKPYDKDRAKAHIEELVRIKSKHYFKLKKSLRYLRSLPRNQ